MEYMGLALTWNNGKSKDVFCYAWKGHLRMNAGMVVDTKRMKIIEN